MSKGSWSASGRRPERSRRPDGSFTLAVARAREEWDALTGGPPVDRRYSDHAAGEILRLAVVFWPDAAAALGAEDD